MWTRFPDLDEVLAALVDGVGEVLGENLVRSTCTARSLSVTRTSGAMPTSLDHGSQALVWDDHCNTAYVRWTLREHGITLMGPEPKTLVDPVPAAVLREEARQRMAEWADWACSIEQMNRWHWPYMVISLCRVLWTMEHGTVVSKRAAGEWALGTLDRKWAPLIQEALAERPDPVGRWYQPAAPADATRTLEFVRYASSLRT